MRNKLLLKAICLLMASIVLLAYNEDPPNGRSGAPFDGHCNNCHSSGNTNGYNGLVEILGLPDTIMPLTTYTVQLKVTPTAGNPLKAGFQLVIVDKNNQNAGYFTSPNDETGHTILNGREYIEHRGGKNFNAAPIAWNFQWTSPADVACNAIKLYYVVNFCNGNGSDFGDFPIAFADSLYFAGGPSFTASVTTIQNNVCPENTNGIVYAQVNGGDPPYQYEWSNGLSGSTISTLATGTYSVTIQDSDVCTTSGVAMVSSIDTIPPQIICPMSFAACAGDTIHYSLPTLLDNCDLGNAQAVLLSGLPDGSIFPIGINDLVFQATDSSGNTASCLFSIEVTAPPTVQVDTIINDAGNAGTGSISITSSEGSGGPITHAWKKNGVHFSTDTEDINDLFAGIYSLEVTDSIGCSVTLASLIVENTVGLINNPDQPERFVITPQPVTGTSFRLEGGETRPHAIELINLQAQVVDVFSTAAWPGPFLIADIPNGLYLLKITLSNGQLSLLKLVRTN